MKDELLVRLESFEINEPGVAFPFSARLARENGWSHTFARRVVAEYKRFVWLAMCAGHPVTPSEEVDEAWHLHLCYTRSYWDGMCGKILGKPLHHGPTEGGKKEEGKFADWYARTLESYRVCFGEEPPADIWPVAEIRFRPATMRKVDAAKHWIVPKRMTKRVLLGCAALGILPASAGCTNLLAATGANELMCFLCMVCLFVFLAIIAKRGGGGNGCGSGCSSSSSCGGGGSSGCGSSGHGHSDGGSSGCGSSGCSSSGCSSGCGGGGCGGGGD